MAALLAPLVPARSQRYAIVPVPKKYAMTSRVIDVEIFNATATRDLINKLRAQGVPL